MNMIVVNPEAYAKYIAERVLEAKTVADIGKITLMCNAEVQITIRPEHEAYTWTTHVEVVMASALEKKNDEEKGL